MRGRLEEEGEEWVFVGHPTEADVRLEHFGEANTGMPLKVVFSGPARHWTDAAPLGNGSLGAMVWGGVSRETLQLNHDTLWTGVPANYTNPQAPPVLSNVRQFVDDGKYPEATAAAFGLSGHPSDVYQPLGDINLDFGKGHDKYDSYERELDLDTALVKVKYIAKDVEFTREHFCSNPHQVFVMKISANKPASVSFTVFLDSRLHHHSTVNGDNQIIMNGSCPGRRKPPKAFASENANPKGIQFAAALDLQISEGAGMVEVLDDRKLRVEGSNWAVLVLAAASSFDGPFTMPVDSNKDPVSDAINIVNSSRKMSFLQLYAYHLDDYQELFRRVTLQLSKGKRQQGKERSLQSKDIKKAECCSGSHEADMLKFLDSTSTNTSSAALISTAERVKSFKDDEDPTLVELLFQYGRYLLISCSRPGTQAANLQGIWNKDVEPAWDAAPHLNINLQMNYWPALSCNLSECQLPLFDFMSSLAVNGTTTAKVNYGADGWVAHQVSDIWAKTSPDRGDPVWALWPMGGAWLCTHLWKHYSYTMDKAQDFEDPDVHHRHLSHLFGLFPGHTITLEKTPDLCKAADYSLYKRGNAGPGWSTIWKMALWAHLQNEQHVYKLIKLLIILVDPEHEEDFEGGLYGNLFTAHPPFQIDANFGFSAAIAEMLVQSTETDLFLLPALPRNKWADGCVKGLKARGNMTVSICWKEGALHETSLWTSEADQIRKLHYNGLVATVKLSHGNTYLFNRNLKCTKVRARV